MPDEPLVLPDVPVPPAVDDEVPPPDGAVPDEVVPPDAELPVPVAVLPDADVPVCEGVPVVRLSASSFWLSSASSSSSSSSGSSGVSVSAPLWSELQYPGKSSLEK